MRRSPNRDLRSRIAGVEQESLPAYVENMVEGGRVEEFSDNGQQLVFRVGSPGRPVETHRLVGKVKATIANV